MKSLLSKLAFILILSLTLQSCSTEEPGVETSTESRLDTDGDAIFDDLDTDDDNDGVLDTDDAFPLDATESLDTDNDGVGNNSDDDDDNDGVADADDAFPLDANESLDADGDGIGNNADDDNDNDGVLDIDDVFPFDALESLDADGDGIGNNADDDDDNDGVSDAEDAFPLDPLETLDTDADGIGNNADEDDDNDNVIDNEDQFPLDETETLDSDNDGVGDNADAYPNDFRCAKLSNGDGTQCYLTLINSYTSTPIVKTAGELMYIGLPNEAKILTFNAQSHEFVDFQQFNESKTLVDFLYHPNHQRLYLSYEDSTVTYVDRNGEEQNYTIDASNSERVSLYAATEYLLITTSSYIYLYDRNGEQLSTGYSPSPVLHIETDDTGQIYSASGYTHYDESTTEYLINRVTKYQYDLESGEFVDNTRYYVGLETRHRKFLFYKDIDTVLFSSGEYIQLEGSTYSTLGAYSFVDYVRYDDTLVTVKNEAGYARFVQYRNDMEPMTSIRLEGAPLAVAGSGEAYSVLSRSIDGLLLHQVSINADSDNDGITNEEDAFPLQPEISIDTDGDGYADQLNDDYTAETATGIEIDAAPVDAACWAAEHLNDSASCDYSATMPQGAPNLTEYDELGTLYLYFDWSPYIFRYSAVTETYLSPLPVPKAAGIFPTRLSQIELSNDHNRLYTVSSNGQINYFNLATLSYTENFATIDNGRYSLFAAGEYLVVKTDFYGGMLYLADGSFVETSERIPNLLAATWDEVNNQIYTASSYYDRYINVYSVNQLTGSLSYELQYYVDITRSDKPFVTKANQEGWIADSSGVLLNITTNDTEKVNGFDAGLWLSNDQLVTITTTDGNQVLRRYSGDLEVLELLPINGELVTMLQVGEQVVIVLHVDNELVYLPYNPNDDIDNDGVNNIDDRFPQHPAFAVDNDNDGYPDSYNPGYSADNAGDEHTLDAFAADSACWLTSHADSDGNCDTTITQPDFDADAIISDANGVHYLIDFDLKTIFVYSSEAEAYLNPIRLRTSYGAAEKNINSVTYSEQQSRIYLSYSDRSLTNIDVAAPYTETHVGYTDHFVGFMLATEQFLIVNESYYYNGSSSIYDYAGNLLGTQSYSQLTTNRVYDEANSRIIGGSRYYDAMLFSQTVDTNGQIGGTTEHQFTTTSMLNSNSTPLLVLENGALAIGKGSVIDLDNSTEITSLYPFHMATLLENGNYVTATLSDGTTIFRTYDNQHQLIDFDTCNCHITHLSAFGDSVAVITNNDGMLSFSTYAPNLDRDNDGIANINDDFPLDPSASLDSDGDGYPDSWHDGYSEDGTAGTTDIDAFPLDAACWLDSHAATDDTSVCNLNQSQSTLFTDLVLNDGDSKFYYVLPSDNKIAVYSTHEQSFLSPIHVDVNYGHESIEISEAVINLSLQRIYLAYDDGSLYAIDLANNNQTVFIGQTNSTSIQLDTYGEFLYGYPRNSSYYQNEPRIWDQSYNVSDVHSYYAFKELTWSDVHQRLYYLVASSRNSLVYSTLDEQSRPNFSDQVFADTYVDAPLLMSPDEAYLLLGSGHLFNAETLELVQTFDEFEQGIWLENGEVVLATSGSTQNEFILTRLSTEFEVLESFTYTGELLNLMESSEGIHIVHADEEVMTLDTITINDDLDGDSVLNHLDAFPFDMAASIDSDDDGYPDSWHTDQDETTSTTGLTLDSHPNTAACWDQSHDDGNGNCDFSATVPEFTPDYVFITESYVLLLVSLENQTIFRKDVTTDTYLEPLYFDARTNAFKQLPVSVLYLASHERLYLATPDGAVTYFDLTNLGSEQEFVNLQANDPQLASAGSYLAATSYENYSTSLVTYSLSGNRIDSTYISNFSAFNYWDEDTHTLFWKRNATSSSYYTTEVDQSTGEFGSQTHQYAYTSHDLRGNFLVYDNGERLLVNSGAILDTSDFTDLASLSETINTAVALNDVLVTAQQEELDLIDVAIHTIADSTRVHSINVSGELIALVKLENTAFLVSDHNNLLTITTLFMGDNDNDGLPNWWELSHGLDDEDDTDAALDPDTDTLTNLEEFLAGTSPVLGDSDSDGLNDFDEIDNHSTDPTKFDSDGDSLGDGAEINEHNTNPNDPDSDDDGFGDASEITLYETDPNDADSIPDALSALTYSFEADSLPAGWEEVENSDADWVIDDNFATDGSKSLRSGTISHSQKSAISLHGLFSAGQLTFDVKVSSESCCDFLRVYLNDEQVLRISHNENWQSQTIEITEGQNYITFSYEKDGSVSNYEDAAFIDNLQFTSN